MFPYPNIEPPADKDRMKLTKGQNALMLAVLVVPVWTLLIVGAYVFRRYWPLFIIIGVLSLALLAPVIRAAVERRAGRRAGD